MGLGDLNLLYSLSGFAVGAIVGMTGVGGGSLMTPLLVLLFGVHPATAVGTDLLYAACTKSLGSVIHARAGSVEWRIVRRLALGSVPAMLLTLASMLHWDLQAGKGGWTAFLLGVVLALTALILVFRPRFVAFFAPRLAGTGESPAWQTVAVGAVIGSLVMLTSVGAGAIGVTALLILYPRLPTLRIVASDIAHAVPLTLLAGLAHWWLGDVDWAMLISLLLGSLPGIALGSMAAPHLPERALRILLAVVLALVSLKLISA
ncbi:MAG: sulfite exporter TauE/SafE family protein [Cypionkella sp.]|jgi:uncharacterized protein